MPKRVRKPRKDQEIVDLADKIRTALGDDRPKSFGLYVKLIKEFGTKRSNDAFWRAVRSGAKDKVRYFLGILSHVRTEKRVLKTYKTMREPLLEKMTPRPQWREKHAPPRNRYRKGR